MQRILASLAVVFCGVFAPPASAQVEGKIIRVGLFAGASPLVRSGGWSFVEVEMRWRGEKPFAASLHVDQFDQDGDVLASITEVVLPPDGEWHRWQAYFVPHDIAGRNVVRVSLYDEHDHLVKMLDERGKEVSELTSPTLLELGEEFTLIVDLTGPRRLPHVAWLDSDRVEKGDWRNARKVRTLAPQDLPIRAQGLEAVDAIVWDNADPSGLSEQQVEALIGWVERGGRLLITGGTNWQALRASSLNRLLPVSIKGAVQTREAQEFTELVHNNDLAVRLDKEYNKRPITRCELDPHETCLPIPADCANPQIAYRTLRGRGSVVFVGASLKELLPVPARLALPDDDELRPGLGPIKDDPDLAACETVVAETFLSLPPEQPDPTGGIMGAVPRDLFQATRSSVGFKQLSGAFVFFAILFTMAYTVTAAGGSYWYLNRRAQRHLCWVAFAVVGIVGSVIGTGMVWMLRGVTTQVWQTTIIDAPAGLGAARADCLFGVKTPDHTRLSLRLPQDPGDTTAENRFGWLQPMPESSSLESRESRFAASEKYSSVRAGFRLDEVPVRATLKEFRGVWEGSLSGTLDARLVARRSEDEDVPYPEFADPSYIRNNLGLSLHDCYLIETRGETAALRYHQPAIGCFKLGDIPKSGPGSTLNGEQLRQRLYFTPKPGTESLTRITKYPRLYEQANAWREEIYGGILGTGDGSLDVGQLSPDKEYPAILLLSVLSLLETDMQDREILRRSHGRSLDCSPALTDRTALLIGWSDDPPPMSLEIDGERVRPSRSKTIYRFVIPVERRK